MKKEGVELLVKLVDEYFAEEIRTYKKVREMEEDLKGILDRDTLLTIYWNHKQRAGKEFYKIFISKELDPWRESPSNKSK